jgi:hypothetical protein
MNKVNLLRMADHIETIPQKDFNMFEYRSGGGYYDEIECNSVGCAVGHCTILDSENIKKNFMDKYGSIEFTYWSKVFTEVTNNLQWEYLFSYAWVNVDNTPQGTAKRIRDVVKNGFPENMDII